MKYREREGEGELGRSEKSWEAKSVWKNFGGASFQK